MKTILALAPLVLALSGCMTYSQGQGSYSPYPPSPDQGPQLPYHPPYPEPSYPTSTGDYRAIGTEPFWDLQIGRELRFTDQGTQISVVQATPQPRSGTAGEMYETPRIRVNIVHAQCSDGMSDRTYPDRVQVWVDGRAYNGCGAPTSYYGQVGENGQPNAMPAPTLNQTNWRVVAINGQQVPARDFYINFMPDRMGAKFGCNTLGAGYSQNGNRLTVGAIMATRMACPDMSFENAGSRVLAAPLTVRGSDEHLTLTSSGGSIDLVRAK